jgi:predicted nuclease of predicted toxin-antitoxin system
MKFLADMGISKKTILFLRSQGHDAIHLAEQSMQKAQDPVILLKARQEDRVLLTHDLDFSDLVAASGETLPSVITFRLRDMRPENVNLYLKNLLDSHSDALLQGAIVSINEAKTRLRLLPIKTEED